MTRAVVDRLIMSVNPGWYADPTVYGGLRWWDGAQWTAHATPQPAQPYAAQQYPPGQPARQFSAGRVILGVVGVVGVLVLAPVLAAVVIPVFLNGRSSSCVVRVPAGASSEAKAYASVVDDYNRQRSAFSRYVNEQGDGNRPSTPVEYRMFRKLENDFANGVAAIPFSGQAAIDARVVIADSRSVVADLDELLSAPTQAAHDRLRADLASSATIALRADLGLPPPGGCRNWEPG